MLSSFSSSSALSRHCYTNINTLVLDKHKQEVLLPMYDGVIPHLCTQRAAKDILPNLRQMDFSSYGTVVISHKWK